MMENSNERYIEKNITTFYEQKPDQIEFFDLIYPRQETETLDLDEIERYCV